MSLVHVSTMSLGCTHAFTGILTLARIGTNVVRIHIPPPPKNPFKDPRQKLIEESRHRQPAHLSGKFSQGFLMCRVELPQKYECQKSENMKSVFKCCPQMALNLSRKTEKNRVGTVPQREDERPDLQ